MHLPYFSASSRVWESAEWVSHIEECGYGGWEVVADGQYRLDDPTHLSEVMEVLASTGLPATVHAPYGDLNLATLNYPIWRESVRQVCTCIEAASGFTDRVTIHPGYLSPVGKLVPEKAWRQQKSALVEIGRVAADHSVLACLENMIAIREFLCQRPEELAGMVEGIEGIGITIDIGHAHTVGRVKEFLPLLGSAHHLHIHDNHGSSDEHLPLGEGTVPWNLVGPAVSRDYRGVIVVEGKSLPEAKRSIAAFKRYFS